MSFIRASNSPTGISRSFIDWRRTAGLFFTVAFVLGKSPRRGSVDVLRVVRCRLSVCHCSRSFGAFDGGSGCHPIRHLAITIHRSEGDFGFRVIYVSLYDRSDDGGIVFDIAIAMSHRLSKATDPILFLFLCFGVRVAMRDKFSFSHTASPDLLFREEKKRKVSGQN